MYVLYIFFFKQKTAYEMRISDWSSDVCSSDLLGPFILIFLEVFVASRRFFQGKAVADEEFSVDLTLSDTVEKIVAIALHMRLAALHLQSFFHDGAQRELVSHAAINAGDRNPPSFAAGENRLFER